MAVCYCDVSHGDTFRLVLRMGDIPCLPYPLPWDGWGECDGGAYPDAWGGGRYKFISICHNMTRNSSIATARRGEPTSYPPLL